MLKHRSRKKKNDLDEKEMAELKAKKRAKTMADMTKAMRRRTLEVISLKIVIYFVSSENYRSSRA